MPELTIESLFGSKAGIVWEALNKNGPSNVGALAKATSLTREEVCGGLGWLGREDKIDVKMEKRKIIFSLRQT
jgi:hypothetical protein